MTTVSRQCRDSCHESCTAKRCGCAICHWTYPRHSVRMHGPAPLGRVSFRLRRSRDDDSVGRRSPSCCGPRRTSAPSGQRRAAAGAAAADGRTLDARWRVELAWSSPRGVAGCKKKYGNPSPTAVIKCEVAPFILPSQPLNRYGASSLFSTFVHGIIWYAVLSSDMCPSVSIQPVKES
jgi:hypothetical protein